MYKKTDSCSTVLSRCTRRLTVVQQSSPDAVCECKEEEQGVQSLTNVVRMCHSVYVTQEVITQEIINRRQTLLKDLVM